MAQNKLEVIPKVLATGLLELRKTGCLTDITICIENKKFECHKVVLAAVSPYFKAMFLSDFKEKEEREIHIQDVKANAFNVILQLIYAERDDIDQQSIECVLSAASMLQIDCVIKRLTDASHFLRKDMSEFGKYGFNFYSVLDRVISPVILYTANSKMTLNKLEGIPKVLATGLLELRKTGCLTDITICIENKKFECHKVVLAAVSPYFKAMFLSEFKEKEEREIHIQDVKANAFNVILQLIYAGRGDIDQQNIEFVLSAASMLQIDCVIKRCEEFLVENLTPDTSILSWRMCSLYGIHAVAEEAFGVITESFGDISKHESFLDLSKDEIIKVISSNELNVKAEEEVCDAVLKWVKKEILKRKEFLYEILQHVRISLLRPRYTRKLIKSDPVFETDNDIICLLNTGICWQAVPELRLSSSKPSSFHRSHMPLKDLFIAGQMSAPDNKFVLFDFNREEILYSLDFGQVNISDLIYTNNSIYTLGESDSEERKLYILSTSDETDPCFIETSISEPYVCFTFSKSAFMIPIDNGIYFFARRNGAGTLRYNFDDRILTPDMSISCLENVHAAILSCNIYLFFSGSGEVNCIAHFTPSAAVCPRGLDRPECECKLDKIGHLEHDSEIVRVLVEDDDIYVLFQDMNIWKLNENNQGILTQLFMFRLNDFDLSNFSSTLHLGKLYLFAAGKEVKVVDVNSGKESVISEVKVPENCSCIFSNKASVHNWFLETSAQLDEEV